MVILDAIVIILYFASTSTAIGSFGKDKALVASHSANKTYKNWSKISKAQPACHVSNGGGCYKQRDICWYIVSDQSMKPLFVIVQQFLIELDGQVLLILGFEEEGC